MKLHITVVHEGRTYVGDVELDAADSPKRTAVDGKQVSQQTGPTRPGQAIERLYERSFFKTPRTLTDTIRELAKNEYNFGSSSVLMALQATDFLRQRGKRGSYMFVQKYPPAAHPG